MKKKVVIFSTMLVFLIFIILCIINIRIYRIEDVDSDTTKILSSEEIIDQVLQNKKEFIDANGNEILLDSLIIEDTQTKINQYAYIDIDADNENELVALTDSFYGYYLVLDIDNNIIYGYNISLSDMEYINNKGIVLDQIEDSIYFRRLKFNKNNYKKINVASYDNNEYMLYGEVVSEEDFNKFKDNYVEAGLLKYKALDNGWMERKINNTYSLKDSTTYMVNTTNENFVFAIDKHFNNFKNDLLEEKINTYYLGSNNMTGKVFIKNIDFDYARYEEELKSNKSIGLYDEETQYIAIIIDNNNFSSIKDDNYSIYYFKYYNKGMQFLGSRISENYDDLFNEDIITELE